MYCYVYDDFVQDGKYANDLDRIENRITDLGLQGKIVRLALFRDADEIICREVAEGVKTVVVVGNDKTVHKVANVVVGTKVTLAILPIGEGQVFAQILGIPGGVEACDVLSQRILEKMDAGEVNGHRFFTGAFLKDVRAEIRAGGKYRVLMTAAGDIEIRNLAVHIPENRSDVSNPTDGKLEIVIYSTARRLFRQKKTETRLPLAEFSLHLAKQAIAIVDGAEIESDIFNFKTEVGALSVVVGRERMFG